MCIFLANVQMSLFWRVATLSADQKVGRLEKKVENLGSKICSLAAVQTMGCPTSGRNAVYLWKF